MAVSEDEARLGRELADERAKYHFHVEMMTKEIELLRAENEKLRALSIKSLDQSIALLDKLAHIDGEACDE